MIVLEAFCAMNGEAFQLFLTTIVFVKNVAILQNNQISINSNKIMIVAWYTWKRWDKGPKKMSPYLGM